MHPDFLKELQTVLSNYFEDIRNGKGAIGQGKPRLLQFRCCNLDPPASSVSDKAPALWIHPSLILPYLQARRAFAAGRGRRTQGKKKEIVNRVVLYEPSATCAEFWQEDSIESCIPLSRFRKQHAMSLG